MKVRVRFTKVGKVRFLGNLDLVRNWERAVRRANLPVAYTGGFSPRPKLHYGLALPLGAESYAEYMDIDLAERVELDGLAEALSDGMPPGIDVTDVGEVPANATALQAVVDHCTWEIDLVGTPLEELAATVQRVMESDEVLLTFERKKKSITENVRPALLDLSVEERREGAVTLAASLATKPRSVRPSELLTCLGVGSDSARVRRIEQWMTQDGIAVPPIMAGSEAVR